MPRKKKKISKDYKNWVTKQCKIKLDPSLVNQEKVYKELDEKIMLGMRLKEGINLQELINEQNWDKKKSVIAVTKLLKEWERFLESGLLIKKGNRVFLSDPQGMELSNKILVSMFQWWEKVK